MGKSIMVEANEYIQSLINRELTREELLIMTFTLKYIILKVFLNNTLSQNLLCKFIALKHMGQGKQKKNNLFIPNQMRVADRFSLFLFILYNFDNGYNSLKDTFLFFRLPIVSYSQLLSVSGAKIHQ